RSKIAAQFDAERARTLRRHEVIRPELDGIAERERRRRVVGDVVEINRPMPGAAIEAESRVRCEISANLQFVGVREGYVGTADVKSVDRERGVRQRKCSMGDIARAGEELG